MAWSTPIATRFATSDDPPTLTNGSVIPVTGATPVAMPTLTKIWNRSAKTIPAATMAEIAAARPRSASARP